MTDSIGGIDLEEESSSHSVNCDSDYKVTPEVHCIQQQNIAKLNRNDLEDLYYQLHDEHTEIKKKFNNLDSKYKIMATRVMRLSRNHKCVESIGREEDQRKLDQLRQNEAALRAKLTVLRGQLASHTRLHSAALSKDQCPRSHRCSRSCLAGRSSCIGDDDFLTDISRPRSQSHSQHRPSTGRSGSQQRARIINHKDHELVKTDAALREEVVDLQDRIQILEKDILTANDKSTARIHELESELSKHLIQQTAENVELIKARRFNKQQEAEMVSLQQELQLMKRELQACKAALTLAAKDQDELCLTLMRERQRNTDLQEEIVKQSHIGSTIRELKQQLNDAKKENAVLKEHSNRLLQLTTGCAETRTSQCSSDDTNRHDIPVTSGQLDAMEQKLTNVKQKQSNLEHELEEVQNQVSALNKNILDAKEERNSLRDEHVKLQSECLRLRTELIEPKEEKNRLNHQLEEVRGECSRLAEELSKCKAELEKHQELVDFSQTIQEKRAAAAQNESTDGSDKVNPTPQPTTANIFPHFHTPQMSAQRSHYQPQSQPHSHPSTPRQRMADARLALLEQTAIRPAPGSFPSVLGSHGSLQERFLELCVPATSVSSGSNKVLPVSAPSQETPVKIVPVVTLSTTEDQPHPQCPAADLSPKPKCGSGPSQTDSQWELEKCRELLRVQFNLNSIYKTEVASLNNIVQSLTSGTQNVSK